MKPIWQLEQSKNKDKFNQLIPLIDSNNLCSTSVILGLNEIYHSVDLNKLYLINDTFTFNNAKYKVFDSEVQYWNDCTYSQILCCKKVSDVDNYKQESNEKYNEFKFEINQPTIKKTIQI